MRRFPLLQHRRRGSNAIEYLFAMPPILFTTLLFVQFYFLATTVYFGITKGYSRAFKEAYEADHTDDTDDELGTDDMEADVFVLPVWRPFLGGSPRNWDPPGDLNMGGDGEYWIAGGSQADWYEVWDPAIGMIGLVEQYMDFPWTSASFSGLTPYDAGDMAGSGVMNTDGMADMAEDAQDEADEAAEEARQEACEDTAEKLAEQIAYRDKANACRNPATYQQMSGPGGPLYYVEGDEGPGEDLFYYVNPPGEDDPDPNDLVPAYPPQYYTCSEDDYQDKGGLEYGYTNAASAQADYNEAVQAINETLAMRANLGC